jgi:hypothetical protein
MNVKKIGPEKIINEAKKKLVATSQKQTYVLSQQELPCPHWPRQRVQTQFRNTQDRPNLASNFTS